MQGVVTGDVLCVSLPQDSPEAKRVTNSVFCFLSYETVFDLYFSGGGIFLTMVVSFWRRQLSTSFFSEILSLGENYIHIY